MSSTRHYQRWLVVVVAGVAGAALAPAPTGMPIADAIWSGLFAAALAWFGGYARRTWLLVAAGAAAALAATGISLVLATVAVVLAAWNAFRRRPRRRVGAIAGGFFGLSLLTGNGPDQRAAAIATTAVLAGIVVVAGYYGMRRRLRQRVVFAGVGLSVVLLLCAAAGAVAGLTARPDLKRGTDAFEAAQVAAAEGDIDRARVQFGIASEAVDAGRGPIQTLGLPARIVPGLAQQVDAADEALDAIHDTANVALRVSEQVDLDAIQLIGGEIDVAALASYEDPAQELTSSLEATQQRLAGIDRTLLLGPLSTALDNAIDELDEAAIDADRVTRTIQVAPELLGADGPQRYLVLFTSPVEARNRFGFPGAYAVVTFDDGRFDYEGGGPIRELIVPGGYDQTEMDLPERATPYQAYFATRDPRSVTVPPHFPVVADVARQMAAQTSIGAIDGVIRVNTRAAAELIGLVGGVDLPSVDQRLTAENAEEFLNRTQYLEFPELGQTEDRKDLLEDVADTVGDRLETADLPGLRELADVFGPLVAGADLALGVPEDTYPEAAELLGEVGADGAFEPTSDVVFVGQINNAANKIDLFLRRQLDYDVMISEDGTVDARLEIDLTNDAPATGLPPYLIGPSPRDNAPAPGVNRTTMLLYSPYRLDLLTLDGQPVVPTVQLDGDMFVYQLPVELGPGQRRELVAELTGEAADPYAVELFPSGLPTDDEVRVRIDDRRTGELGEGTFTVRTPARVVVVGDEVARDPG